MAAFKDVNGKTWDIRMTIGVARRIKSLASIDIFNVDDDFLQNRLFTNPMTVADVLWAIVQPEAEKSKIDSEMFGESLGGSAMRDAQNALVEELADFFTGMGQGSKASALKKMQTTLMEADKEAMSQIEKVDVTKAVKELISGAMSQSQLALSELQQQTK